MLDDAEGARHVQVHVTPKPCNLPDELTGTSIFAMLKAIAEDAVPRQDIRAFCKRLRAKF